VSVRTEVTVEGVADILEPALAGPFRRAFVDEALAAGSFPRALDRLRSAMRVHRFRAGGTVLDLVDGVERLDRRTRSEGFRVLHAWNYRTHEFSRENTPVMLLDYFRDIGMVEGTERSSLALLLDHYLLHVLTLCTMRAWDAEDPVGHLARLDRLVELLQGEAGSGHRFVASPEMLLILGMSQFHPEEEAYDRLVGKVLALEDPERRVRFARLSTAVLAGHLRWGFGVMYRRDLARMRDDNEGDYPWLLLSVTELLRAYDRLIGEGADAAARDPVVEGIANGLTPDPWALLERPPKALHGYGEELATLHSLVGRHRDALLEDLERHRPGGGRYSPLELHFNFPHNAFVAKVLIALHRGSDLNVPMDVLFASPREDGEEAEVPTAFARTLMEYSGVNPQGYDQHGARFVVHDARAGLRHFGMALSTLRKLASGAEG